MGANKEIKIADRFIGIEHPPFVAADMSGNHNHSLERALQIVDAVADAGADAVKLQTYTADTMTLNLSHGEFAVNDPNRSWNGKTLHDLYDEAHTPWAWHEALFKRAKERGLICFSTPFDATSVDFLETLKVPCYKIASFENTDIPLIRKVASTGKPIIISTGMASIKELEETVGAVRDAGCEDIILLKCTSTYPSAPEEANLATIPHLRGLFNLQVGLSDHTLGIGVGVAGVAFGATFIEKHFTLSHTDGGVDSSFSMEPGEMKLLAEETKRAWQAIGKVHYGATEKEKASLVFRRSIYISRSMKAGDEFTQENLKTIRPGHGLPPKYMDVVLGRKIAKDAKAGTPMSWDLLA